VSPSAKGIIPESRIARSIASMRRWTASICRASSRAIVVLPTPGSPLRLINTPAPDYLLVGCPLAIAGLTTSVDLWRATVRLVDPPGWLIGPAAAIVVLLILGGVQFALFASGGGLLIAAGIAFWVGAGVAAFADPARQVRNAVIVAAAVVVCLSAFVAVVSSRPAPPGASFGGPNVPRPTP
jgi:hypothetical protein